MKAQPFWKAIAAIEVVAAAIVIWLDLFIPTILILGIMRAVPGELTVEN